MPFILGKKDEKYIRIMPKTNVLAGIAKTISQDGVGPFN